MAMEKYTMILPCDCIHKDQDELNGKGKRVHNSCKKGVFARCTVCGKEKLSGLKAKEVIKGNK